MRTCLIRLGALSTVSAVLASTSAAAALAAGVGVPSVLDIARSAPVERPAGSPGLRFGIYPGGDVGTVDAPATEAHDDAGRRLALLRELKGDRPLVMHIYATVSGTAGDAGHLVWAEDQIRTYADSGLDTELVLRHQPASRNPRVAAVGYERGVRDAVRKLASQRSLVSLQITNEPNLLRAPAAGDGAFPGVRAALVRGVIAADQELRRAGRPDLLVGFNVAHGAPGSLKRFFSDLRRRGGRPFRHAVDWVGLDIYPGTWSAPRKPTQAAVRSVVTRALRELRVRHLPAAGLGRRVALHVSENGYPTGPGRSAAAQAAVMRASLEAVARARVRYGVTDYRWFDLWDADSASPHMEHQYGVVRSDFVPKPGFYVLRDLVAQLSSAP